MNQLLPICSITELFPTIFNLHNTNLCLFCTVICKHEEAHSKNISYSKTCECNHEGYFFLFSNLFFYFFIENNDFLNFILSYFFPTRFFNLTGNEILIFNKILDLKLPKIQSLWNLKYKSAFALLKSMNGDLAKYKFKWKNYSLQNLKELNTFMSLFYWRKKEMDTKMYYFLNINEFRDRLFSLDFIEKITSFPFWDFQDPIYDEVLEFFTYLIHFFLEFHFKIDIYGVEGLLIDEIENVDPIARMKLRIKNFQNQDVHEKYFKKDFNLTNFTIKLLNGFLIGKI